MATLHKFKLLATQCAVAGSPTRSPTTSPVIHLRRRKTLRMLLSRPDRRRFSRREGSPELDDIAEDPPEMNNKEARVRRKLKDLFVSSPPLEDSVIDKRCELEEQQGLLPTVGSSSFSGRIRNGSAARRLGTASLRPVSAVFRHRLLRRAWRPKLVTIPE
ncbi:50S ribosomal protein-like protein [Quillaja saponaria]|uniref:50S ribosomal protein-like protein n=1 Tax=Quillaja saponaria TaxID=32244 RepID=A0AAD7Q6I0_QUISA|nr:50S ribosomal protein-like protein [Quillaja saponaria]